MTTLEDVLTEVGRRVSYLRATPAGVAPAGVAPAGDQWIPCDTLCRRQLDVAIDAGVAERASSRQVAASLFSQSYAFKVGAVSLAAYVLGMPWPSPAAIDTSIVLAKGRATQLSFRCDRLGDPGDPSALGRALVERHLIAFSALLRGTVRLGARLVAGNVAAASAAAFRAVEGAARDRGDHTERLAVRERAQAFFEVQEVRRWLGGTGRFEVVEAGAGGGAGADGWFWTRTSCCLWYQAPGPEGRTHTCDDCSLITPSDLEQRRRAELAASLQEGPTA